MSHENVEIVRRHVDAYLSGDTSAALAAYHPEVEERPPIFGEQLAQRAAPSHSQARPGSQASQPNGG